MTRSARGRSPWRKRILPAGWVRRVAKRPSASTSFPGSSSKSSWVIVARSQGANRGLSARGFRTGASSIERVIRGLSQIRQFVGARAGARGKAAGSCRREWRGPASPRRQGGSNGSTRSEAGSSGRDQRGNPAARATVRRVAGEQRRRGRGHRRPGDDPGGGGHYAVVVLGARSVEAATLAPKA